jgi:hypothetical protein
VEVGLRNRFMRFFSTLSLAVALMAAGCASRVHTVTPAQLSATIQKHWQESVNNVSYIGSDDGNHHIVHSLALYQREYRVSKLDLVVESPFPRTDDTTQWRSLRWDLQPMPARTNFIIGDLFEKSGR